MNNIKYSICSNPDCIPVIHSNWYSCLTSPLPPVK